MSDQRKEQLMNLGQEVVVEALLSLTLKSELADDLVERMLASPKESIQRFKKGLASLKRSKRFIGQGQSHALAQKLAGLLQDLEAGVSDPELGVDLVVTFFKSDNNLLGNCDDSNGSVGDVFRYSAAQLFAKYAVNCQDKDKVVELVVELNKDDQYGLRDSLVDCAGEYLSAPDIRKMIQGFQTLANSKENIFEKRGSLQRVESLANQLGDGELFEKTRRENWQELSAAAYVDIARVYLKGGGVETALSWLEKCAVGGGVGSYDRDELLEEIYTKKGDEKSLSQLFRTQFKAHRSLDYLERLLKIIGEDQREQVVAEEVTLIQKGTRLSLTDVQFLIAVEKVEIASEYIIRRSEQLNGDFYFKLPELAQTFEGSSHSLTACLILRSLLSSLLDRAQTKAYGHGVRYLKKLDQLAPLITDWKELEEHAFFMAGIRDQHGRKRSFWTKYEGKS